MNDRTPLMVVEGEARADFEKLLSRLIIIIVRLLTNVQHPPLVSCDILSTPCLTVKEIPGVVRLQMKISLYLKPQSPR